MLYSCLYSAIFLNAGIFLLVADEEGTIEEQEMMEGGADHKAELADLAKDGNYFLYFFDFTSVSAYRKRLDWKRLFQIHAYARAQTTFYFCGWQGDTNIGEKKKQILKHQSY